MDEKKKREREKKTITIEILMQMFTFFIQLFTLTEKQRRTLNQIRCNGILKIEDLKIKVPKIIKKGGFIKVAYLCDVLKEETEVLLFKTLALKENRNSFY